jgi:hypothetical protein
MIVLPSPTFSTDYQARNRRARPDGQNPAQAQTPDEDRPTGAQSELRTASIDVALSSLFAPPMNSSAGETAGAADTIRRAEGAAHLPAAETRGSAGQPEAPQVDEAVLGRVVGVRTFILPTNANAASRTEAAVENPPLIGEFPRSAAPLATLSMSRVGGAAIAMEAAGAPTTFDEQPTIAGPLSTKTSAPAARGGARLASTHGVSAASPHRPAAALPGSTDSDRRPTDWTEPRSADRRSSSVLPLRPQRGFSLDGFRRIPPLSRPAPRRPHAAQCRSEGAGGFQGPRRRHARRARCLHRPLRRRGASCR